MSSRKNIWANSCTYWWKVHICPLSFQGIGKLIGIHLVADYPRLRFTFRCDLACVINLICIVLYRLNVLILHLKSKNVNETVCDEGVQIVDVIVSGYLYSTFYKKLSGTPELITQTTCEIEAWKDAPVSDCMTWDDNTWLQVPYTVHFSQTWLSIRKMDLMQSYGSRQPVKKCPINVQNPWHKWWVD